MMPHPRRHFPIALALAALGLALSVPASAQSMAEKLPVDQPLRGRPAGPVPDSLRPAGEPVLIPELTEVPIVLKDDLKSGGTHPGSEVLFFVARDIYAPGNVMVLAKDTPVVGHVALSKRKNIVGEAGKMFLTADYILAQDGTRIPLRGVEQQARGRGANTLTVVGGALTLGVALLFITGNDTDLHAGRQFLVYTQRAAATAAPLPAAEVPTPVKEPSVAAGPPREALVILKDGTFVAGLMRTVGNDYLVTNSAGSQRVHARDVHSIEYASDAGYPGSDKQ